MPFLHRTFAAAVTILFVLGGCRDQSSGAAVDIRHAIATDPVGDDADDPTIWVHPSDPSRSVIIGTNKVKAPNGALVVFGIDGKIHQTVAGLDRPNNVDVEYGLRLGHQTIDIAVATERLKSQLRVFRIAPDGSGISDVTSTGNTRVFEGRAGEAAAPMGISLYRRPRDGVVFAIVAPETGPPQDYLAQYRLEDDGRGRVKASFVRYFGSFSEIGEIEAVAVDDALGYIYYVDGSTRYAVRRTTSPQLPQCRPELRIGEVKPRRLSGRRHYPLARKCGFGHLTEGDLQSEGRNSHERRTMQHSSERPREIRIGDRVWRHNVERAAYAGVV